MDIIDLPEFVVFEVSFVISFFGGSGESADKESANYGGMLFVTNGTLKDHATFSAIRDTITAELTPPDTTRPFTSIIKLAERVPDSETVALATRLKASDAGRTVPFSFILKSESFGSPPPEPQ